ncbi:MAG TPA: DUF2461 family protein [Candidatus Acidoferrales bacterium]|nr:DUF2461 family protein [Candidatus Acidoferrales bacterium]
MPRLPEKSFAEGEDITISMSASSIFTADTVRFFRELSRDNNKTWMDANRERYKSAVVEPFRALLDRLAPEARKLNPQFVASGRVGDNFSRINRDIRFARDKTPYRPQMYLHFAEAGGEGGQIYLGISADCVTCGFRIYGGKKTSALVQIGRVRGSEHGAWLKRQEKRIGKKYESYWYTSEKGVWTKHAGWPLEPQDWKKIQGWVVRKKFPAAAASRASLGSDVAKIFRDVMPLLQFAGSAKWKP